MPCPSDLRDPFRCPTKEDYLRQICALLPRGRAWGTHVEEAARSVRYPQSAGQLGRFRVGRSMLGRAPVTIFHSVIVQYWCAFAALLEAFAARACALLNEFFCVTLRETREFWHADYGFPDPCDPWEDLCEKVAAQGGARCEYFQWAAARRGWRIECIEGPALGATVNCFVCGCDSLCGPIPNRVFIRVILNESPAHIAEPWRQPQTGCAQTGCVALCDPFPEVVQCLIERIKPAHVEAVYETV